MHSLPNAYPYPEELTLSVVMTVSPSTVCVCVCARVHACVGASQASWTIPKQTRGGTINLFTPFTYHKVEGAKCNLNRFP